MSAEYRHPADESYLGREIAQLRIAHEDRDLPAEDRIAAFIDRLRLEKRAEWSRADCALAAMTGRPPETFRYEGDEYPPLDELERVGGEQR